MCSSDHALYLLGGRVEGKVHDVLFSLLDDGQISTPSLEHQSGIHILWRTQHTHIEDDAHGLAEELGWLCLGVTA